MRAFVIGCAIACVLGGSAVADDTGDTTAEDTQFIQPPAGWTRDDAQATALAAKANSVSHFGGAKALATTEVFIAPTGSGASLYLTAVVGTITEHRDAAARVEVDSFLAAPKRAQLSSPTISIAQTGTVLDPKSKLILSTVQWADTAAKTATHARLVVAADDSTMVAITVECVVGVDTPAAVRDACAKTFATIDPELDVSTRVAVALAPEGTEPPPGPNATGPKPTLRPSPTMSDGTRAPMPAIEVQRTETKRTTDTRPVYVGLGIIALAAVFWWNRRRRERFEKEPNDDDN
jgi:hypothetical protein